MMQSIRLAPLLALCLGVGQFVESASEKEIVFGLAAEPISLDPAMAVDKESYKVIENLFEGLVRLKPDLSGVEPALADRWETSEDGLTWTFHLRRNVLFHDGTPMNAESVLFSLNRQIDPEHPFFRKDYSYGRIPFQFVESISAVNDFTVRFQLTKAYAPFLHVLAMEPARIISPSALTKHDRDFCDRPVGTGPFRFQNWVEGKQLELVRFDDYHGKKAHVEQLTIRFVSGDTERFHEFQSGRLDVVDRLDPRDFKNVAKLPDVELERGPGLEMLYIAFNTRKEPFDDVRVRRAFNLAINKDKLVKLLFQDLASPAHGPLPDWMWAYDDDTPRFEYDPEKAKKLLEEAGFPRGLKVDFYYYSGYKKGLDRLLKANLSAVGIRLDVIHNDFETHLDRVYGGEHQAALLRWTNDNGDPDNFFHPLLHSDNIKGSHPKNRAFFDDPELDKLIVQAQQTMDRDKRRALYAKAQKLFHERAPWIALAHLRRYMAHDKKVQGLVQLPTLTIRFHKARVVE